MKHLHILKTNLVFQFLQKKRRNITQTGDYYLDKSEFSIKNEKDIKIISAQNNNILTRENPIKTPDLLAFIYITDQIKCHLTNMVQLFCLIVPIISHQMTATVTGNSSRL